MLGGQIFQRAQLSAAPGKKADQIRRSPKKSLPQGLSFCQRLYDQVDKTFGGCHFLFGYQNFG